jgi:hypothetical protein
MRFFRIVALMMIAALLLSACGAATATTADEMTPSGQRFLLALPRLVMDVDDSGQVTLGGLGMDDLSSLIPGMAMEPIAINPYYVDWMKNTDVQHVELVHTNNGIFLYVNGELLPYLAWDGESLSNVGSVAGMANIPYAQLISLLVPIIERTGLDVALRFPTQEGAEPIAMRDPEAAPEPVMAEAGPSSVITHIDVDYDANGVPMIAGITSRDLLAATNVGLPVDLTPESIAAIQQYGIENLRLISANDGIYISVNDMPLPHIAYDTNVLDSAAGLYAQVNPDSPYINLANLLLPQLANVDFDMKVSFPAAQ